MNDIQHICEGCGHTAEHLVVALAANDGITRLLLCEACAAENARAAEAATAPGAVLASWSAPGWAQRSRVDPDGAVIEHLRSGPPCARLDPDGGEADLAVWLSQVDSIETGPGGTIRVVRSGEPVVAVGELRLTPGHARSLARALSGLAGAADG